MAISYRGSGSNNQATATSGTLTPGLPLSNAAGDTLFLVVAAHESLSIAPVDPAWSLVASNPPTHAAGVLDLYAKVAVGSDDRQVAYSGGTSGPTKFAQVLGLTNNAAGKVLITGLSPAVGEQFTGGTIASPFAVASTSDPGIAVNDWLLFVGLLMTRTGASGLTFAAANTGTTWGSQSVRSGTGIVMAGTSVSVGGSGSGNITATMNYTGGVGNVTDVPGIFVRVRESDPVTSFDPCGMLGLPGV